MRARSGLPLRRGACFTGRPRRSAFALRSVSPKAHHILAEIIQGGLVLETNGTEIDRAGECSPDVSPLTLLNSAFVLPHTSLSARGRAGTEGVVRVCQPAVARWRWSCWFTQCWAADTLRVAHGQACRSWCQVAQSYPEITTLNAHDPACAILVL